MTLEEIQEREAFEARALAWAKEYLTISVTVREGKIRVTLFVNDSDGRRIEICHDSEYLHIKEVS